MDEFLLPFIFLIRAATSFLLLFQALLQAFSSRKKYCLVHAASSQDHTAGHTTTNSMDRFYPLAVCFKLLQTFLAADSTLDINCSHYIHHVLLICL
jgi:hypothetical protein